MDAKSLQMLELPRVLEQLAAFTLFSASRELALALVPDTNSAAVAQLLAETSEARRLLQTHPELTVGGARDVRQTAQAAARNAALQPAELLEIKATLAAARELKRGLARLSARYPLLSGSAQALPECPGIVEAITAALNDRGEVLDGAAPRLRSLRSDLRSAHDRLLTKLQSIVSSARNAPYLQEPIITQRGDRYVIPLKANFKGRIRGLVHDQSTSGATLFIEPLAVVELANQWRTLQSAEAAEVRRILLELSALVGAQATAICALVQLLAELDLALAKARHADALQASPAQLQAWAAAGPPAGSGLQLRGARHPLLPAHSAVAIDAVPQAGTRIIVISGPNTGGKTVALKTIALLALMNQCGLHIPALPGSALPIFSGVYADIGDEQSLQQNLSTFSAHLTNIIRILAQVDARALVVLDELGAGTDPSEGSALARAILSHILESGATTIVSSHSHKLKDYAHNTPGVTNASVEFDPQTLAPTYRLTIGLPGRSNALAIAARLGLPQSIVAAARTLVTAQDQQANNLLEDIQLQLQVARAERALAESEHAAGQQRAAELALLQQQLAAERTTAKAAARASAAQELDVVRLEAAQLRADLREARLPLLALRAVELKITALEETLAPPEPEPDQLPPANPGTVRLGDSVLVVRLNAIGVVTALTASEAEVRVGRLQVRAQLDELRPAPAAPEPTADAPDPEPPQRPSPGLELHLRGERVEDGLEKLERHLDAAALAGLPWVRIVHGKGTGRMRSAVRSALRDNPQVTAVQSVPENEGGEGVTLAMLA
ncbi:endonuclease MutS2 [Anaerolineaceae bacterium]|nr:endonuclease MutS2 [Anaerolineaceae bacterium]